MSFVYAWMTKDGDKEGIEKFDKLLFAPPPGIAAEHIRALPEWSKEAQGANFMAQLAARGNRGTPGPRPLDSGATGEAGASE